MYFVLENATNSSYLISGMYTKKNSSGELYKNGAFLYLDNFKTLNHINSKITIKLSEINCHKDTLFLSLPLSPSLCYGSVDYYFFNILAPWLCNWLRNNVQNSKVKL